MEEQKNGLALTSLILGVIAVTPFLGSALILLSIELGFSPGLMNSLIIIILLNGLIGIAGLICGILGFKKSKKLPEEKGKTSAIIGIILSGLSASFILFEIIAFFVYY